MVFWNGQIWFTRIGESVNSLIFPTNKIHNDDKLEVYYWRRVGILSIILKIRSKVEMEQYTWQAVPICAKVSRQFPSIVFFTKESLLFKAFGDRVII